MLPESSIRRLCDELGIPFPPSNEDEIKQAYNKAVLRHHPDKGGTTERFGAIQDAKKFLLGYMQEMRQQQEREQEEREQEEKTRMRRQQERETQQEIKNIGRELEQMLQEMRKRPDLVSTFNKKFQDKYLAYVSKIQKFSGASFGDPAFGSQGASQPFGGGGGSRYHDMRQFTDTSKFTLRCNVCQLGLVGEKEAVDHAHATGHDKFSEY